MVSMKTITKTIYAIALTILAFASTTEAQTKRRVGEYYVTTKPTFAATAVNDLAIETPIRKVWEYYTNSTTVTTENRWREVTDTAITNRYFSNAINGTNGTNGTNGANGKDATITIGSVNTTTLPAGSQAQVTITDANPSTSDATLNFQFGIPQGAQGASGSGGSGTINMGQFPFIIVISNKVDDTAQLQAAIDSAKTNWKTIWLNGVYRVSNTLWVAREHIFLDIRGYAELRAINSNKFTMLMSPVPPNNGDAEGAYTNRRISIDKIHFRGLNNAQSGINFQSSLGVSITECYGWELDVFITMPFGLRAKIDHCEANGCRVGFVITTGEGRWQGAGSSTSCSNGAIFTNNRVYCQSWTDTAVVMVDASHLQMRNNVIEGHSAKVGLYYKSTATTADGANLYDWHFELINGTTDAQLIIRSSTRNHTLDRVYFYTNPNWTSMKGWHLKLEGGGYKQIDFVNYSSGKFYDGSKGASIAHDAGTNYNFINCDDPLRNQTTVKSLFNATINYACGTTAGTRGANTFCFQNPVNR